MATTTNRLQEKYKKKLSRLFAVAWVKENIMNLPKIEKIVINQSLSDAVQNAKILNVAADEIATITGQKASDHESEKSIANFKLREGMPIGVTVTLRKERMWSFFDRLITLALPRVRDFRGLSPKGFDGRGNYNMGLKEQTIFPEINYDKVDKARGMNITICTSAENDAEGRALLESFGFPFRK